MVEKPPLKVDQGSCRKSVQSCGPSEAFSLAAS
jgi:hypothetical protein